MYAWLALVNVMDLLKPLFWPIHWVCCIDAATSCHAVPVFAAKLRLPRQLARLHEANIEQLLATIHAASPVQRHD
jgi:hypothetical protein